MTTPNSTQPINAIDFLSLNLRDELKNNINTLGYETMTPIQAMSLPIMLEGKDIIAQAKTGSGKTVAFGLSLLNNLNIEKYAVQSLILCPTRELAEQVSKELRRLARLMTNVKILNLSGGIPLRPQMDSLRHGAHVIVGTPGRILKHLEKKSLTLKHLKTLILDEADRMLDMGFFDEMKKIILQCPTYKQALLFSATYPAEIKRLSREFMKNPKEVVVESVHTDLDIVQRFYEVKNKEQKVVLLKALLEHYNPSSALVFCNTKQLTADLTNILRDEDYSVMALHGDMDQIDRDLAMIRFANKSCSILVATDVAARGLDIKELPLVINYELGFEVDTHTHRIGRTGRAGEKGVAISFILPSDNERLAAIKENYTGNITWGNLSELVKNTKNSLQPEMVTLYLDVGRKDKIRPGDILGALTKDAGLPGESIGKIIITDLYSCVAVNHNQSDKAFHFLQEGKLKGRKVRVKKLR